MCNSPMVYWYSGIYPLWTLFSNFWNILDKTLGQNELHSYEQHLDILLSDNQFKHQAIFQSTQCMYYCKSVSLFTRVGALKCLFSRQRSVWNFFHFLPKKIYEHFIKLWSCFYLSFWDQQKMVSVMPPETHQSILMADISSVKPVQENCQVSLGKLSFLLGEWIIYDKYWMIGWETFFVNCILSSSAFSHHNYSSQFLSLL